MPEVDPVILQLKADLASYKSDLTGAQRLTDQKLSAIEARGFAMGQNLKSGFNLAKGAAIGFIASIGVQGVINAARQALEYASSLGEVAQQLGVTTDALQEYRYAGSQAGLSNEEMDQALSQLTRRLGEAANGTKAQADAFKKLGIDVRGLTTEDAIPLIAEALSKIPDPAKRAAIEMDLFGRAGQKLEPLLAGGAAGVNALREDAHRLGLVLSEDLIKQADDAADSVGRLKRVLDIRIAAAVAENAKSIDSLVSSIIKLIDAAGSAIQFMERLNRAINNGSNPIQRAQNIHEEFYSGKATIDLPATSGTGKQGTPRRISGAANIEKYLRSVGAKPLGEPRAAPPAGGGGGSAKPAKAGAGSSGHSGPSADEIEKRFNDERASLMSQYNSALGSMARSADERAEYELRSVELARIRTSDDIRLNKDYSAAQKQILQSQVDQLAEAERQAIEFNRRRQAEADAADLADERHKAQRDALQQQYDLATTEDERRAIALKILEAEEEYLRAKLDAVIASKTASDVERQRAQIARDALDAASAGEHRKVERDHEGPLGRYAHTFDDPKTQAEQLVVDELNSVRDGIHDAMHKALGIKDPRIGGLLDILLDQILFKPLAQALSNAGGGGGGGFFGDLLGSVVGSLFGRASGGPVQGGQMYRVNEGASAGRVEAFVPQGSGHIIPLGRMNALPGRGMTLHQTINIDTRGSVNPDGYAEHIRRIVREDTIGIVGQGMKQVNANVPARLAEFDRDGR